MTPFNVPVLEILIVVPSFIQLLASIFPVEIINIE